jgi:hypothetical protein
MRTLSITGIFNYFSLPNPFILNACTPERPPNSFTAHATVFPKEKSPMKETLDTNSEVAIVHQLIHMQIRFLQMESLYGQAMRFRVEDILTKSATK